MRKQLLITIALFNLSLLAGCTSLPSVPSITYRPPVQQGNIINEQTISQLKLGMHQEQVVQILGEPVLRDPYHDNRWFYVYTYVDNRAKLTKQHRLTLYFNNGQLVNYISTLQVPKQNVGPSIKPPNVNKKVENKYLSPNSTDINLPMPKDLGV